MVEPLCRLAHCLPSASSGFFSPEEKNTHARHTTPHTTPPTNHHNNPPKTHPHKTPTHPPARRPRALQPPAEPAQDEHDGPPRAHPALLDLPVRVVGAACCAVLRAALRALRLVGRAAAVTHYFCGFFFLLSFQNSHARATQTKRSKPARSLNLSVTTPYNADFDGDEMNMHIAQVRCLCKR